MGERVKEEKEILELRTERTGNLFTTVLRQQFEQAAKKFQNTK